MCSIIWGFFHPISSPHYHSIMGASHTPVCLISWSVTWLFVHRGRLHHSLQGLCLWCHQISVLVCRVAVVDWGLTTSAAGSGQFKQWSLSLRGESLKSASLNSSWWCDHIFAAREYFWEIEFAQLFWHCAKEVLSICCWIELGSLDIKADILPLI